MILGQFDILLVMKRLGIIIMEIRSGNLEVEVDKICIDLNLLTYISQALNIYIHNNLSQCYNLH